MLTVKAAAVRAGVSASLIYALCQEGKIAHLRLGRSGKRGCIRIKEVDLDAFIEECKREPPEEQQEDSYRRHLRN
jgi:excisionase family DNA binding protein